jgi:transcription initiation factor IIE alpha subunit
MIHLTLDKVLYTDTELATMLGISKRHLRNLRNRGLIEFFNTKPIRYTRNMIEDFIKAIEKNPALLLPDGNY